MMMLNMLMMTIVMLTDADRDADDHGDAGVDDDDGADDDDKMMMMMMMTTVSTMSFHIYPAGRSMRKCARCSDLAPHTHT